MKRFHMISDMPEVVKVALGTRSYEVRVGHGLIERAGLEIRPLLKRLKVAVVVDEKVAELHLETLVCSLQKENIAVSVLRVPSGEASKSWAQLSNVCEWLLSEKIERQDVVIAFGGGVIGDLVGFAAAIVLRGIRFVQIPTTLLAQVDSSVGGKTGINTAQGKNLIGSFHQPSLVLADSDVLQSLSRRDFLAGYGEVIKYALLGDATFFDWLDENATMLFEQAHKCRYAVRRSVEMKADIVARDETEQGDRALLNLGHTFCHALEKATGYSDRLLHGEGVAIGCLLAFDLSARLGLCSHDDTQRLACHLEKVGTKKNLSDISGNLPDADGLITLMGQDKKVIDGQLRFVLVRGIGKAFVSDDVPLDVLRATLNDALKNRS